MMISNFLKSLTHNNSKLESQAQSAVLSAVINPRFHKARQQVISRFLNSYVRYMFDSVRLGKEITEQKKESIERISELLRSTILVEDKSYADRESREYTAMMEKVEERALETCDEALAEAKRKAHQLSQLSQSVLADQRNHLLLSKTILMAKRNEQEPTLNQLSIQQLNLSPADAFAAKLLEDSETHSNRDNIDILCYASLAEGIRSVAKSQMNHFFQMHRFEQEHSVSSFNGISSDEITEQLDLDISLVLQYDTLIALEQEQTSSFKARNLHDSSANLSDSF